jgi:hypothetical protein
LIPAAAPASWRGPSLTVFDGYTGLMDMFQDEDCVRQVAREAVQFWDDVDQGKSLKE